jgi:hypothetical protein
MRDLEGMPVRFEPQLLNLLRTVQTLTQEIIFERQETLLKSDYYRGAGDPR